MHFSSKKITAWLFWIVSFFPLMLIILSKFLMDNININHDTCFREILESINVFKLDFDVYIQLIFFIIVIVLSVLTYYVFLSIYLRKERKKIHESGHFKKTRIISFTTLTFEHYTYFILTLLFPFIFIDSNNVFDLLLILSLIVTVIYILVKTNKIALNPIFLFSSLNVYDARIKGNSGEIINIKIVTDINKRDLEKSDKLYYSEYFDDLYIILKKK